MIKREDVVTYNREIKAALETILTALNQGQRKKLMNDPTVKPLLDRYKIDVEYGGNAV